MERELNFKTFDTSKSDFNCTSGEVCVPTNLRFRPDSTLAADKYIIPDEGSGETPGGIVTPAIGAPIVEFDMHKIGMLKSSEKDFNAAVASRITGKGYFYQPFFVRYALRLSDGTYVKPSAPILMLPTVLPPCIGKTDKDGAPDYSRIGLFSLDYRIIAVEAIPDRTDVASLDIFVSETILTYIPESLDEGAIMLYSDILRGRASARRGRSTSGSAADKIFDGHYSEGNTESADHYLDAAALSLMVAGVSPNPEMSSQTASCHRFYKVASLPWRDVTVTESFSPLLIDGSTLSSLTKGTMLSMDTDLSCEPVVSSSVTANGDKIIGISGFRLPKPYPIASSTAHSGAMAGLCGIDTETCVYIRSGGKIMAMRLRDTAPDLSLCMPRYLYYPDRRAFLLTITQGETIYGFDLSPHPKLDASQWIGSTAGESEVATLSADPYPKADTSGVIDYNGVITSAGVNFTKNNVMAMGDAKIIAISKAARPPRQSTFGRYSFYAFTTAGVYMLDYSPEKGVCTASHRVSSDKCVNPLGVAESGDCVYYTTQGDVRRISGSDTTTVSDALKYGCYFDEMSMRALLADCRLYAHEGTVMLASGELLLAFDTCSESWWRVNADTAGDETENERIRIECATRPIRVDGHIAAVELLGRFQGIAGMTVYGAATPGDWQEVASGMTRRLDVICRSPYRYLRVDVAGSIRKGGYLYGLRLHLEDDQPYEITSY